MVIDMVDTLPVEVCCQEAMDDMQTVEAESRGLTMFVHTFEPVNGQDRLVHALHDRLGCIAHQWPECYEPTWLEIIAEAQKHGN